MGLATGDADHGPGPTGQQRDRGASGPMPCPSAGAHHTADGAGRRTVPRGRRRSAPPRAALTRILEPGDETAGRWLREMGPVALWQALSGTTTPTRPKAPAGTRSPA